MTPLSPLVEVPQENAMSVRPRNRAVWWGAIFAGWTAATALQILFIMLGAGLGFSFFQPTTDESPLASVGTGAVIIQGVSAVFSLWFGGWVAGRLLPVNGRRASRVHGFLVWCASTLAGVALVAGGAGWITGDLAKLAGGGLSAMGKPAAAAVGASADLAKDGATQMRGALDSFTSESLGGAPNRDPAGADAIRAKREITMAVARLFNPAQESKMQENRTALVKTLAERTGKSEADANQLVTEWTDAYNDMKQDVKTAKDQAEAKARQVAEESSHNLAIFSLSSFLAFVLGAIAATLGARHGAASAEKRDFSGDPAVGLTGLAH